MIKPISPKDVQGKKNNSVPDAVIKAVNDLIVENWSPHSKLAVVFLKHILPRAKKYGCKDLKTEWLDHIESIFSKNGWDVTYDCRSYYVDEDASFIFSAKQGE